MSIKMEVWGDYACFTRPEMKVERVSYDVRTPSAARGMVESVYFHNGLRWIIDRIYVCNPIRFINIRRNEVPFKVSRGVHAAVSWVSGMHGAFPALGWRRNPRHRRNEGFGLYAF